MADSLASSSSTVAVESTSHQMHAHPVKINVTKFDEKGNFGMWRCEVMDALCSLNLEDVFDDGDECPEGMTEKVWLKMNQSACGLIRNYLTHDIKYSVMTETSAGNLLLTAKSGS